MRIAEEATMIARRGNILQWTASGLAGLLACLGAIGLVIALINNAGEAMSLAPIMIALAIPICLVGRACLYVLAGR
jgi:hypothetical protein